MTGDESDDDRVFDLEMQTMSLGVVVSDLLILWQAMSDEEREYLAVHYPDTFERLRQAHDVLADLGTGEGVPPVM